VALASTPQALAMKMLVSNPSPTEWVCRV